MEYWDNAVLSFNYLLWKATEYDYGGAITNFFGSLTFEDFVKIIAIYLLLLWASIVVWVTKDIINRTNNIFLQIFAILTVLLWTPLWVILYFMIRPSQTLFERHYEENDLMDEESYALDLIDKLEKVLKDHTWELECRGCKFPVKKNYKYCPICRIELVKRCDSCGKEMSENLNYCPDCGHDQEEKVTKILTIPNFSNVFWKRENKVLVKTNKPSTAANNTNKVEEKLKREDKKEEHKKNAEKLNHKYKKHHHEKHDKKAS